MIIAIYVEYFDENIPEYETNIKVVLVVTVTKFSFFTLDLVFLLFNYTVCVVKSGYWKYRAEG